MSETMVHKNAATSLYGILSAVRESGANTWARAWGGVLDAKVGTEEFVVRHSEVMGLLAQVAIAVQTMQSEHERGMYRIYLGAWHSYVSPQDNWGVGIDATERVDIASLHMLSGLGKSLDADRGRLQGVGAVDTDRLEEILANLEGAIEESGLPPTIATQVSSQIAHIRWLIDFQGFFGSDPIEREVTSLAGRSFGVISKAVGVAKDGLVTAFAALYLFLPMADTSMGHLASIAESSGKIADEMNQLVDEPKALEAPRQKELTAGENAEEVEAELVDEEEDGEGGE